MKIKTYNPANGQLIAEYTAHNADQQKQRINSTHECFLKWNKTSFPERRVLMGKLALLLMEKRELLSQLMTEEMGKPIRQSRAEIEKCAWVCRYYAENAAFMLSDEEIETEAIKSFVSYQPIGVVLAIMPWNFPFWQLFRFAAPALMAGNTALLKHASNVPACATAIEMLFLEAGFPANALTNLLVAGKEMEAVIGHSYVCAVTLTGSVPAGKAVASMAGKHLKKTVLELGGNDPYLVLADASLSEAARICCDSRLLNSGQSCINAKRIIVVEAVFDEFLSIFRSNMENAKVGEPLDESTDVGPMARVDLREELQDQVNRCLRQGAICALGGKIPDGQGAFYPPTILTSVEPGMVAFEEELFGPVAAVVKARDKDHAIKLANQSEFGLGAAIFTSDLEEGERIAKWDLQAGACFVNGMVKSDPRLPFGGIKHSGYGRELSHHGIKEFVNVKTIVMS